jgi:hypothetical protein
MPLSKLAQTVLPRPVTTGMPIVRVLLVALIVAHANRLLAQRVAGNAQIDRSRLAAGTQARYSCGQARGVVRDESDWCYGRLERSVGDTIVMVGARDGSRLTFAPSTLEIVEVNPSRRGSRGAHAEIGAVVGALVGAAFVFGSLEPCRPQNGIPCGLGIPIVLPAAITAGMVGGGVVGALLPAARWVRIRS